MKHIFMKCRSCVRPYSKGCKSADEIVTTYDERILIIIHKVFRNMNISLNKQDVEDCKQHVLLKLFDKNEEGQSCWRLKKYDKKRGASPNGWIALITTRLTTQFIRDRFEELNQYNKIPYDLVSEIVGHNQTFMKLETNEEYQIVENAIQELSQDKKLFCRYHFNDGLSINEVCRIMNISISNGHTKKHRIIKELKLIIQEKFSIKKEGLK